MDWMIMMCNVGSSVLTNVLLWCRILRVGSGEGRRDRRGYMRTLYSLYCQPKTALKTSLLNFFSKEIWNWITPDYIIDSRTSPGSFIWQEVSSQITSCDTHSVPGRFSHLCHAEQQCAHCFMQVPFVLSSLSTSLFLWTLWIGYPRTTQNTPSLL